MAKCVISGVAPGGGGVKIVSGYASGTSVDLGGIPQILFVSKFREIGCGQYSYLEIRLLPQIGDTVGVLVAQSDSYKYFKITANGFEATSGSCDFYYLAIF